MKLGEPNLLHIRKLKKRDIIDFVCFILLYNLSLGITLLFMVLYELSLILYVIIGLSIVLFFILIMYKINNLIMNSGLKIYKS